MATRRNQKQLEEAITRAISKEGKALAYYNLGVFHDNNGREAKAVPNYLKALELGLDAETRARALAWLASSLYKAGRPEEALASCRESLKISEDERLTKFLVGLERRILRALYRQ